MSYLIFDLAILAILALFFWRGYARGLVLTLCSLLAVFVALIGASFLKAADIVTHAAQALAHFVAVQIARIVIFAVAFFAVLIAWFFLSHALDLVAKLPVLSTVNAWGGGAVGLVKGALIVYIAVWLLRGSYIPPAAIEGSYLLKFFASAIPLSFFL